MTRKLKPYSKSPVVGSMNDLNTELTRIEQAFDKLGEHIATETSSVSPPKSVDLQIRYADGVNWNPGKGAGLYIMVNNVWMKFSLT